MTIALKFPLNIRVYYLDLANGELWIDHNITVALFCLRNINLYSTKQKVLPTRALSGKVRFSYLEYKGYCLTIYT